MYDQMFTITHFLPSTLSLSYISQASLFFVEPEFFLPLSLSKHKNVEHGRLSALPCESDDHSETLFLPSLIIFLAFLASPPKILLFSTCSSFTLLKKTHFPDFEMLTGF